MQRQSERLPLVFILPQTTSSQRMLGSRFELTSLDFQSGMPCIRWHDEFKCDGIAKMISGLSHITFITHDLEMFSRIVVEVLGGEVIYDSGERQFFTSHEKFFTVGEIWIAIMEGASLPSRSYNHIAFKTDDKGLEKAKVAAEKLGLEIKPSRPRVEGEGQSLYFYSYDNHLIELHTGTLGERLKRYNERI